ncbi:MAG: DEAD/DEAH box helicase [Saprospiraceae bacterium]|nr:DEAD/DEAH box helicase [Saprospiraceae bacterium]
MEFSNLNISRQMLRALDDIGFKKTTDIQEKAFSTIMSGRDVVGIAQTGTGKTIAYLLPVLRLWKFNKDPNPRILILVPTRELTLQVKAEIDKLTEYMNVVTVAAYGGINLKKHSAELMEGCDIVVATPGRLLDLIWTKALNTKFIKKLIIDEVDEMLNLGFRSQLNDILELLPEKKQNLLFSATITEDVSVLIDDHFNSPERIISADSGTPLDNITQVKFHVPNFYSKVNLLKYHLQDKEKFNKVIIFLNTKKMSDILHENIVELFGDEVGVIHSNKSQNYRLNAISKFDNGEHRLLIATDILARGIDLNTVSHVINFHIPEEAESYVHRIGRTGRAEAEGRTISYITEKEKPFMKAIEGLMEYAVPEINVPATVEISEELLYTEIEEVQMPNMNIKNPTKGPSGAAFHTKKDKNINITVEEARRIKRRKRLLQLRSKAKGKKGR